MTMREFGVLRNENALDTVRLIQNATLRASTWSPNLQGQVLVAMPRDLQGVVPSGAWVALVATFASPDEHPVEAAARLAKYLLAYQEAHGRMPTLASVQRHAADRHIQENR